MNFKNILKTILLIFLVSFYACDKDTNSEENSDSDVIDNPVDYTLTTKNIAISQTIEGITESRSVIIQTPIVVDLTKNYPIVFAFHGNGGTNTSWVNRLREFTGIFKILEPRTRSLFSRRCCFC